MSSVDDERVSVCVCACARTSFDLWVGGVSKICMNANVQFGSGANLEEACRGSHRGPKGFRMESPEKPMWLAHRVKSERDGTRPMSFHRFVLSLSQVRT